MKSYKLFLAIALSIFSMNILACNITSTATTEVKIIFVNGIDNQIEDACASMENISAIVGVGKYSYSYFYNPTDLDNTDVKELAWQAHISNTALSQFGYSIDDVKNDQNKKLNYYSLLGGLYKSEISNSTQSTAPGSILKTTSRLVTRIKTELAKSSTSKVVLVAHSQGNFYVEAAYSIIVTEALAVGDVNSTNLVNRLRIVGIASVAGSTPNNRYLSHKEDVAVFTGQNAVAFFSESNYHPLDYNAVACVFSPCTDQNGKTAAALYYTAQLPEGGNDIALHNFQAVYLNQSFFSEATGKSFPAIILSLINDSVNELNPPSIASISPTTATAGEVTTFTVAGTNLPTSRQLDITFNGCANIAVTLKSENLHKFTCTPQGAGTITADIRATAGGTILKSQQVMVTPVATANLLLGATVSDSCFNCTIAYNGDPNNITDGNMESGRNLAMQSGTFHIFLTNPKSIGRLRLLPAMTPNGLVYYEIQTSTDPTGAVGTWTSHGGEKSSEWANNTWFDFTLNTNTQNVRVIKVNVTYTPSWLAFFEIEAYAP